MAKQKVPSPRDIKAAAQAAAATAQAVTSSAMRIPPATERLNTAIDRAERYLALADPMIRTMDAMLPQLEALVATGNDVYKTVSSVPGVAAFGRLAGRGGGVEAPASDKPSKRRSPRPKS
jgi:hypothetical protein